MKKCDNHEGRSSQELHVSHTPSDISQWRVSAIAAHRLERWRPPPGASTTDLYLDENQRAHKQQHEHGEGGVGQPAVFLAHDHLELIGLRAGNQRHGAARGSGGVRRVVVLCGILRRCM